VGEGVGVSAEVGSGVGVESGEGDEDTSSVGTAVGSAAGSDEGSFDGSSVDSGSGVDLCSCPASPSPSLSCCSWNVRGVDVGEVGG
jgi:hypothetical protein